MNDISSTAARYIAGNSQYEPTPPRRVNPATGNLRTFLERLSEMTGEHGRGDFEPKQCLYLRSALSFRCEDGTYRTGRVNGQETQIPIGHPTLTLTVQLSPNRLQTAQDSVHSYVNENLSTNDLKRLWIEPGEMENLVNQFRSWKKMTGLDGSPLSAGNVSTIRETLESILNGAFVNPTITVANHTLDVSTIVRYSPEADSVEDQGALEDLQVQDPSGLKGPRFVMRFTAHRWRTSDTSPWERCNSQSCGYIPRLTHASTPGRFGRSDEHGNRR